MQMPSEMRSDDCSINKNQYAAPLNVPSIEPSGPSKIARRKRPNSYRPCTEPDQLAIDAANKRKRPDAKSSMITVVTSQSTQSSSSSKCVAKSGPGISVQIEVSEVSKSSTSHAVMNVNNNEVVMSTEQKRRIALIALSKFPIVLVPRLQIKSTKAIIEQSSSLKSNESAKEKETSTDASTEANLSKENVQPRTAVNNFVVPKKVDGRRTAIDEHNLHLKGNGILSNVTNTRTTSKRIDEHRKSIAADHDYFKPKDRERRSDVIKVPIEPPKHQSRRMSTNLILNNAEAGIVMALGRSARYRPKITYQCDGCSYFSEVKSNYDRHLLLHKSCMTATRKQQTITQELKMIAN